MIQDSSVFCLIPARSGSRRVPDKNIRKVGGVPMLTRGVQLGLAAFGRVFVSTDSPRYADIARAAGATVPDLRPAQLAGPETAMSEVVRHAVESWVGREEVLVLVQVTAPFLSVADVRSVVARLRSDPGLACALTAVRMPPKSAYTIAVRDGHGTFISRRWSEVMTHAMPELVTPSGGAYAAPLARLRQGLPLIAEPIGVLTVEDERSIDIDDEDDLEYACRLEGR